MQNIKFRNVPIYIVSSPRIEEFVIVHLMMVLSYAWTKIVIAFRCEIWWFNLGFFSLFLMSKLFLQVRALHLYSAYSKSNKKQISLVYYQCKSYERYLWFIFIYEILYLQKKGDHLTFLNLNGVMLLNKLFKFWMYDWLQEYKYEIW